jgi:hypothetical protein
LTIPLLSSSTNASSEGEHTPQPKGLLGRFLGSTLSKITGWTPSKQERPIAQPGKRFAPIKAHLDAMPSSNATAESFGPPSTVITSQSTSSGTSAERMDVAQTECGRGVSQRKSSHRPHGRKRFNFPPSHISSAANESINDDGQACVNTPFKAFQTQEEYEAEKRTWLADKERQDKLATLSGEDLNKFLRKEWISEERALKKKEEAEELAKTGEKRKRSGKVMMRTPSENYIMGRTADGRGFAMNHDELLSSDEEPEPDQNYVEVRYSLDSASSANSTPAKGYEFGTPEQPPAKKAKHGKLQTEFSDTYFPTGDQIRARQEQAQQNAHAAAVALRQSLEDSPGNGAGVAQPKPTAKFVNPNARRFEMYNPEDMSDEEDDEPDTAASPVTDLPTSAAEQPWTQVPPSRPTPAHASLPVQEAEASKTEQEMAIAISKQRALIEKHKPKVSSRLRQERTFDSPLASVTQDRDDYAWRSEVRKAIMNITVDQLDKVYFPNTPSYVESGVINQVVQDRLDLDFTPEVEQAAKNQFDREFDAFLEAGEMPLTSSY